MLTEIKMRMTGFAVGRALLHVGCILRGGNWRFHLVGIRREIRR